MVPGTFSLRLYEACDRGNLAAAEAAIDGPPRLTAQDLDMGHEEDWYGRTALMVGASSGHLGVVELLLEKGAGIDVEGANGSTALMWAAQEGRVAAAELLLQKGAGIDVQNKDGWTALMWAAMGGHNGVVMLLLEKGAEIDLQNYAGTSALLWAARHGHEAVVRLLLQKGAEIDMQGNGGDTALLWAAWNGHEAVVRLLLANGANWRLVNRADKTAMDVAANDEIKELLSRAASSQGAVLPHSDTACGGVDMATGVCMGGGTAVRDTTTHRHVPGRPVPAHLALELVDSGHVKARFAAASADGMRGAGVKYTCHVVWESGSTHGGINPPHLKVEGLASPFVLESRHFRCCLWRVEIRAHHEDKEGEPLVLELGALLCEAIRRRDVAEVARLIDFPSAPRALASIQGPAAPLLLAAQMDGAEALEMMQMVLGRAGSELLETTPDLLKHASATTRAFLEMRLAEIQALYEASSLDLGAELGSGGFGSVHELTIRGSDVAAAVKIKKVPSRKTEAEALEELQRELKSLKSLCSPRVARYLGMVSIGRHRQFKDRVCGFVMERLMPLEDFLSERREGDDWVASSALARALVLSLGMQVAECLQVIHEHPLTIVHRDMHFGNLLLRVTGGSGSSGISVEVVLADFGEGKPLNGYRTNTRRHTAYAGRSDVVPPEGKGQDYSTCSPSWDVWALGLALLRLALWGSGEKADKSWMGDLEKPEVRSTANAACERLGVAGLYDIAIRCLESDPAVRPAAGDVKRDIAKLL